MISSSLSRIEQKFIFQFLKTNKVAMEIKSEINATEAVILGFNNKEIKIELVKVFDEFHKYHAKLKVFFYFQNNYYAFNSEIVQIQNNVAIIKNPESVAKNLQRKFDRVLIEGKYQVEFDVEGEILPLDFPQTKITYLPNKAPVNADFTNIRIDDIIKRFRNKLSSLISDNKITMLRHFTPSTFMEQMVIEYGKILYVPKTISELRVKQTDTQLDILKKDDWIDFEIKRNKTNPTFINKAVSSHLLKLKDTNIFSYVILPVLYRNYVVALIYLINQFNNPQPIDEALISYAYQFSRILSFSLKINGYFKEEEGKKDHYITPVFDLSPGGLAFYLDKNILEDKLLIDRNLNLHLNIKDRKINVKAKLVRKFTKLTRYYYGFMFLDIKNDDFQFLKNFLYD
ncbi:MAG: PilZ domain-containing protein [Spirochaetes bacterium]|nr:PilZ domain-containing protein [Spirochaetota bacterium]